MALPNPKRPFVKIDISHNTCCGGQAADDNDMQDGELRRKNVFSFLRKKLNILFLLCRRKKIKPHI